MAFSRPIVFVVPETHEDVSGGNLYNAGLLSALQATGSVPCLSVSEWQTAPPEAAIYLVDSLNLSEFELMQARRVTGQFFVLLVHHLPSLEPGADEEDGQLALEKRALPRFDGFLATSQFTEDYLRSQGLRQPALTIEPVVVARNPATRSFDGELRALMACNLIARKGVLAFLETLAAHTEEGDAYRLDIVGRKDLDAAYSEACARCIASSGLLAQRVTLRGTSLHTDMPDWYEQAAVFLSAARMETFGISLQEARSFGLPILAVAGGNSGAHVTEGRTGELFASPDAMASGFLALVRAPSQLRRYFEQAQASRPVATQTWAGAATRLMRSLEQWFPG